MKIKHNSIATYEIRTYKRNADPLERWPKRCRNSYSVHVHVVPRYVPSTNNNHVWSVSTTRKAGLTVQKPTNSHGCHHTAS